VWRAYKRWNGAPAREARTSVRGCRRDYLPGETVYAEHDIELHLGRTAVDMNPTLQEIALDVMPQHDSGIPVAEHPLERSAS
jgi:hypothetical protein